MRGGREKDRATIVLVRLTVSVARTAGEQWTVVDVKDRLWERVGWSVAQPVE
jgi:hypothetical protein